MRRATLLFLGMFLASRPFAAGAGPLFSDAPEEVGSTANTYALSVGDLDADGDLDLVRGNLLGSSYYSPNAALGPPYFENSVELPEALATGIGDLDRDGDLDIVLGGSDNLRIVWNEEPSVVQAYAGTDNYALALGDVDGDGDLDIAVGELSGRNAVYRNDGTRTFIRRPVTPAENTRSIALGDLDGDDDLDIVCGNATGPNCVYRNDGTWIKQDFASQGATQSVALGDLDGDGDLDALCGFAASGSEPGAVWYRNSAGALVLLEEVGPPSLQVRGVSLGDVDQDGDLDAVLGVQKHALQGESASSMVVLNMGGRFSRTADWESQPDEKTQAIALADVDGDGDLDLLCGNEENTTLYLNRRPPFSAQPAWTLGTEDTRSVSLGDVNGDGLLDLVSGNHGSSTVRLNRDGGFLSVPDWQSLPDSTNAIALGDVDGDGDLDLVLGNGEAGVTQRRSTLYLNGSGTYQAGGWLPDPRVTNGAAWGDVDGDGRLDLVCGNGNGLFGEPNTLYRNEGNILPDTAAWTSADEWVTQCVALHDLDADGDLDLVAGNLGGDGIAVYRNQSGSFENATTWFQGNDVSGIALGDLDGDADPDLVATIAANGFTSFDNENGTLSPVAAPNAGAHLLAAALGDVDRDGDLDAVFGGLLVRALYENDGGQLLGSPSWSVTDARRTASIALGDVDDDGDLDVVAGSSLVDGQPRPGGTVIYRGLAAPPFTGDPGAPANQLPENAPFLTGVRLEVGAPEDNQRVVRFRAFDVESDPLHLVAQYQFEGESLWRPVETPIGSESLKNLTTSPQGIEHSFIWKFARLVEDAYGRDVQLRLRAVSLPHQVSLIQHAPAYVKDVGLLMPLRALLVSSVAALDFPGPTTTGDTALVVVTLENHGTDTLVVHGVDGFTEMEIDASLPIYVAPGAARNLTFRLIPRVKTSFVGNVLIRTNDPFQSTLSLPVHAVVLPLGIAATRLLNPAERVPLDEPVPIVVTPDSSVRVERGFLHYRPGPSGAFTDSVALAPLGGSFIASVPREAVIETGFAYYASIENSGLRAVSDSIYFQAVEPPAAVFATPEPNAEGSTFEEGRDIRVQVGLPGGSRFEGGTLFYREGGASTYQSTPILPGEPLPAGVIPGTVAGVRGVDYRVEVETQTGTIASASLGIQVSLSDVREPVVHPARTYRLFSAPLELDGSLRDALTDDLGGYDPSRWRLFAYDADSAAYVEGPRFADTGRAYWIVTREPHRLGSLRGRSTPATEPFALPLAPGFNLVGNPFAFPVAVSALRVASGTDTVDFGDARMDSLVQIFSWTGTQYDSVSVTRLDPWSGYWIRRTRSPGNVTLLVPPQEAPPAAAARSLPADDEGWSIAVTASCRSASSSRVVLGVHPAASDRWDRRDRFQPPLPPGPAVYLHAPHAAWDGQSGSYAADVRRPFAAGEGQAWFLDVAKNFVEKPSGDAVVLDVSGLASLPENVQVVLVDRHLDRVFDLRAEPRVMFFLGAAAASHEDDARFVLLAGEAGYAAAWTEGRTAGTPTHPGLQPGYPNPFRAETRLRFDLARSGRALVSVMDARGALVTRLLDADLVPGRYEIFWNGRDAQGARVAAGMYFVRLSQDGFAEHRKLLLLP